LDSDAASDEGSTGGNLPATDEDAATIVPSTPTPSLSSAESTTSLASDVSSVDPASTLLMKELPWVPKVR
jgi:hypothetical protein